MKPVISGRIVTTQLIISIVGWNKRSVRSVSGILGLGCRKRPLEGRPYSGLRRLSEPQIDADYKDFADSFINTAIHLGNPLICVNLRFKFYPLKTFPTTNYGAKTIWRRAVPSAGQHRFQVLPVVAGQPPSRPPPSPGRSRALGMRP